MSEISKSLYNQAYKLSNQDEIKCDKYCFYTKVTRGKVIESQIRWQTMDDIWFKIMYCQQQIMYVQRHVNDQIKTTLTRRMT